MSSTTTLERTNLWEVATPLLNAMYAQFQELSKKKPDDAISKNKIAVVNRLLQRCRDILESEDSLEFLDLLDEEDLPKNSDVVLMLSQYVAAMKTFRKTYHQYHNGEYQWMTD